MATGSLTITAQREKAVDFSKPFMDFTMSLILRKPEEEEPNMFRFLDPFAPFVWLCTVMAVSICFIACFSTSPMDQNFIYLSDAIDECFGYPQKTIKKFSKPSLL